MPDRGTLTLITDRVTDIGAEVEGDRVWVAAADLPTATGWELKPVGLCRGDTCVPFDLHPGLVDAHGRVDLARLAPLGDEVLVVDPDVRVAVLGASASARASDLRSGVAPEFTLPDLDGAPWSLADQRGRKTVVVAFATWCGCAYELPGWQALHDELAGEAFGVVAVAVDEEPEVVRPFTEGIGFPVLIDRDRLFAERYALTNVPTVVWVDEQGDLVRGQDVAFPTETFREFHRIDSTDHLDGIRRWVRAGQAPADDGRGPRSRPRRAARPPALPAGAAPVAHRPARRRPAPLRSCRRAGAARLHRAPRRPPAPGQGPVPRRGVPRAVGRMGRRRPPVLRPPELRPYGIRSRCLLRQLEHDPHAEQAERRVELEPVEHDQGAARPPPPGRSSARAACGSWCG